MLESLASALKLTPDERRHLFLLAGESLPPHMSAEDGRIDPSIQKMLDELNPNPAYVLGKKWDFLAWNRAADAVLEINEPSPPHDYNLIWRHFTVPSWREGSEDWEAVAQRIVTEFRTGRARYLEDVSFQTLIDDLKKVSPDFTRLWSCHETPGTLDGYKIIHHTNLGAMEFDHITLQFPNDPDRRIMIYMPYTETKARLKQYLMVSSS